MAPQHRLIAGIRTIKKNKAKPTRLKESLWWASEVASEVASALMCKMYVKEVWRRNKRMGSSRSLWLLGGTRVPATAGWQITPPGYPAVPNKWGPGQAGGVDGGCIAALQPAEVPVHGRGT